METLLGERLDRAIAAKDAEALVALLSPDIDFRAMTPGSFWEATTTHAVVADVILGQWFEDSDRIEAIESISAGDDVEDLHRVAYRFRVRNDDGRYTVEQQAYYDVKDDQIDYLRIICSGYRPIGPAT